MAALPDEVEQLRRRAETATSSSSMPPGSDGPAARAEEHSPRPRGGQTGHEGPHARPGPFEKRPERSSRHRLETALKTARRAAPIHCCRQRAHHQARPRAGPHRSPDCHPLERTPPHRLVSKPTYSWAGQQRGQSNRERRDIG
ncbi:hypothetical protein AB0392_10190 [Nonomuraea angiospora]